MLKLTPIQTEPTWLDLLPGVRLRLKPPTVVMILAARNVAGDVYRADRDAAEPNKDPHIAITATIEMVRAYARQRIDGWEGIGDEAGEPIPATRENIDRAMGMVAFHEAFDLGVLAPAMAA
jgi:hypothetical protein